MILCVRVYRLHGDQVLLGGSIGCPQEGADGNWGQFSLFSLFWGVGVGSVFTLFFSSLSLSLFGAGSSFPLLPLLSPEPSLSVFR